jgi:acyl-CoA reductase-like NAD-dependent aldehyde dehydrogenase
VRHCDTLVVPLSLASSLSLADESKGYFVEPTVILTKDPESVTMREEVFGPVLTVRFGC